MANWLRYVTYGPAAAYQLSIPHEKTNKDWYSLNVVALPLDVNDIPQQGFNMDPMSTTTHYKRRMLVDILAKLNARDTGICVWTAFRLVLGDDGSLIFTIKATSSDDEDQGDIDAADDDDDDEGKPKPNTDTPTSGVNGGHQSFGGFGSGNQQGFGSGNQQGFGSGNQQGFGTGNQGFGAGNQQGFGTGGQQGFGTGAQQGFGSGTQQGFGGGTQQGFGGGGQGFGSGTQQASGSGTQGFGGGTQQTSGGGAQGFGGGNQQTSGSGTQGFGSGDQPRPTGIFGSPFPTATQTATQTTGFGNQAPGKVNELNRGSKGKVPLYGLSDSVYAVRPGGGA
ncbi:hypothetical protein TWF730_000979 [Orbilia blumenaviensis]|uniref:Uncharacterized protein n=1 Tax=Orbilia blumenaviensis TaxID=1796055 RepID=A0AAV9VRB0_9PEZI